jgi:mono/diheme cytochrome c family protein
MQTKRPASLVLLTMALAAPAFAQTGDVRRGLGVAQEVCATCHGVRKGQPSPNASAPTFETIAAVPGMTTIALQASLQTSHKTMPNLILPADDRANVAAYIMSLKSN